MWLPRPCLPLNIKVKKSVSCSIGFPTLLSSAALSYFAKAKVSVLMELGQCGYTGAISLAVLLSHLKADHLRPQQQA